MEILKNDEPRFSGGRLIRTEEITKGLFSDILVYIVFPLTEENIKVSQIYKLGNIGKDNIELELCIPSEFNDKRPTMVELILDYEMWTKILVTPDMYAGDPMEVAKRELSKTLCEFFLPIVDGRV